MKRNVLIIAAAVLLLAGSLCSCREKINSETDDLFFEISPNSKSQLIEKELNGITFKFCLLNEQGQPATVFKEGENIIFNFSLKNNLKENISIPTQFINDDFYRVYGNDNTDMGKAWTGVWCNFRYDKMEVELSSQEQKKLRYPWRLSETFQTDYPLCKGDDMNSLPQGAYYTSLHFNLLYVVDRKQISVENIVFKIQ